jgi:hypothetical protein
MHCIALQSLHGAGSRKTRCCVTLCCPALHNAAGCCTRDRHESLLALASAAVAAEYAFGPLFRAPLSPRSTFLLVSLSVSLVMGVGVALLGSSFLGGFGSRLGRTLGCCCAVVAGYHMRDCCG